MDAFHFLRIGLQIEQIPLATAGKNISLYRSVRTPSWTGTLCTAAFS